MKFESEKQLKKDRNKTNKSKRKIAVLLSIAVVVAVAGACIAAAVVSAGNKIDVRVIDQDAGEYMLVNVSENYTFMINKNKSAENVSTNDFKVYDIEGNLVKTSNNAKGDVIRINAPDKGYEKGGVYTLDLQDKGTFQAEEYNKAKKITFIVAQKNMRKLTYQDGVLQPGDKNVTVSKNSIAIKGTYKNGDIIVADTNNDDIDEIYQLKNATVKNGETKAAYENPSAENVYKDINVFYSDSVDFRDAQIDEDALLGALHEMGVLEAFTDEVYAADDSNIDVTVKKKGKNEFQFNVVLKDPKDKNKELEISFGVQCQSLAKYDKKTAIIDNSLTVTSGMEFTVKGKDKEHIEKSIKAALKDYGNASDVESSQGQYEVPFVPIKIPLVGPVCLNIELGLTSDVTFSAEFNAGMETSLKFSQGVIYDVKKQKEIKKYADITGDVDAHLLVHGTLDAFAGIYGDTSLDIPLLIELGINAKAGPYLDSEGLFSITGIPDDMKSKGYYKLEIGVSCNANWTLQILTFDEKSNPIADRKRPIVQRSKELDVKEALLKKALAAYDDFLSQETITLDDGRVWHSEYCKFAIPYISNSDVPELMIYDTADNDHVAGYGALFQYHEGKVILVGTVALNDIKNIGYYKGTGYLMDNYTATGLGCISIIHIIDLKVVNKCQNDFFEIYLDYESNEKPQITGYGLGIPSNQDAVYSTESEFYERLRKDTRNVKMTEYEFFQNTKETRSEVMRH